MTEERKQELGQLLSQAMRRLVIKARARSRSSSSVNVDTYRQYLQVLCTFYPPYSLWGPMSFEIEDMSETAKSKLLGFIRDEFAPFISEDMILPASRFIHWGYGLPLDEVLEQLLKIAIVQGIEEAVFALDKYIEGTHNGFYQYIVILMGITLKTEIRVGEGIRLVPAPISASVLPSYLPDSIFQEFGMAIGQWSVLIVDIFRFPINHRPLPTRIQEYSELVNPIFWAEIKSAEGFPIREYDFHKQFCQALSLACNHRVEITHQWKFSAETEFFHPYNNEGVLFSRSSSSSSTEAGVDQIEVAKQLNEKLVNLDSRVREKLQIPIDRWIKSKADGQPVDKMIDLGIAFEALYLSDINEELTFRLGVRAAWFLGKDGEHRKALLKRFVDIYRCRSNAVHSGRLDEPVRFGYERIPINEFIERVQDLCRDSIMKVLNAEQFPDRNYWDGLIVGGEDQQASSA